MIEQKLSAWTEQFESETLIVDSNGKCPRCSEKLLIDKGEKQILKSRLSIIENGTIRLLCKKCKAEVNVPLEMLKSLSVAVRIGQKRYKMTIK